MRSGTLHGIKTLLVDDEALARRSLRPMLVGEVDITIIGEACDGPTAVKAIQDLTPDLVLLDIQLPGFDGFEVLRRVGSDHFPSVIFVTAYDHYAVKAFDVHAADYLLKPVTPVRLHEALRHLRETLASEEALVHRHTNLINAIYTDAERLPQQAEPSPDVITRIAVKHGGRYVILQTADIDWIDSADNYVELHARGVSYLQRGTLNDFETRLPLNRFARIHRTHIVNLNRVRQIEPVGAGDFEVILHGNVRLTMSRTYSKSFFKSLYHSSE